MQKKKDLSPFYRRLIADAWNIAVMHKHLWIFGFFATIVGFAGVTEVFFHAYDRASQVLPSLLATQSQLVGYVPGLETVKLIISYSPFPVLTLVLVGAVALLLLCVFVWMAVVSIGALAIGTRKISRGGEPTFGDLVKAGSESFWGLLAINLSAKAVIAVSLFVTGVNLFALMLDKTGVSEFFYFCSFVLFTAISFVASVAAILGSVSLMVRGNGVKKALLDALNIIAEHWLICLETAVLLLIANVIIGAGAAVAVIILSVPFIFLIVVASLLNSSIAIFTLMVLTGAMLVAAVACLGSFLTTFETAAWMLLWTDLSNRNAAGILTRWAHRLSQRLSPKK